MTNEFDAAYFARTWRTPPKNTANASISRIYFFFLFSAMLNLTFVKADGNTEGVNPKEFTTPGGKEAIAKRFGFHSFDAFNTANLAARSKEESSEDTEAWARAMQPISSVRQATQEVLAAG